MTTAAIDLTQRIQERDGVSVVLYTKPACPQCDMTKRQLDRAGIHYTTVDVTEDETALWYIKDYLGYLAAPVVVVAVPNGDEIHFNGFRPDLIAQHITKRGEL
ncbi:glutaredoxin family protein [Sinomonas susongensis]|uniref:glutaredoxin family protein n=1 Tax=Sinomonas susongensis TaxID=1324851 RepID=UPI001108BB21|nr:glutaredoxin family protein [Sinomonas susongensis]